MRVTALHRFFHILLIGTFLTVGCSDDATTTDTGGIADASSDQGAIDGGTDAQQIDKGSANDGSSAEGKATDVKLGMHDNEVKIKLSTMKVSGKEATDFDLYMAHDDGPNMYLGPGVTGQNLGDGTAYHQLDTAPDTGYVADDTGGGKLVIGTSWRSGGSGTTGFTMNKNIYVVKLADGTYAKIEVLSAKAGEVHVLCYRQSDGTRNIKTTP